MKKGNRMIPAKQVPVEFLKSFNKATSGLSIKDKRKVALVLANSFATAPMRMG